MNVVSSKMSGTLGSALAGLGLDITTAGEGMSMTGMTGLKLQGRNGEDLFVNMDMNNIEQMMN